MNHAKSLKNNRQNVVLTGFMGTGKTTVGKLLATQLGYTFVDTDDLIQEQQSMSIPEIFSTLGEDAFRQMEAEVSKKLGQQQGLVISTGGGLMLNPDNASALSRQGQVFCLIATPEEILARIRRDESGVDRPLLAVPDPKARIVALLEARQHTYGRFKQLVTSGKDPATIVQLILELIK